VNRDSGTASAMAVGFGEWSVVNLEIFMIWTKNLADVKAHKSSHR
jgi:hypothetical protein